MKLPLEEAPAKVRAGPPLDNEADYALSAWAGVLPLHLSAGEAIGDPRLPASVSVPAYVANHQRAKNSLRRTERRGKSTP